MSKSLIKVHGEHLQEFSFNPSTVYEPGLKCKKALEQSRHFFANLLNISTTQLFFTSGGTEGNNTAIHCFSQSEKQSKVCWYSQTAHPSLIEPILDLKHKGFQIYPLPISDHAATIDVKSLQQLPAPSIVACEWVNSESGLIQPIESLAKILKGLHPNSKLIVDGVQGFGKLPIPSLNQIDAFIASGHKIGAPIGIGLLYIKHNKTTPLLLGGGQENGWRSGTTNVPTVMSFIKAYENISSLGPPSPKFKLDPLKALRSSQSNYSPYLWLIDSSPVDGEVLLHQLEAKNIFIGLGSACRSSRKKASATHLAMGLSETQSRQTVRISFCPGVNETELKKCVDIIHTTLEASKKYFN